jgi:hypothetical protein
MDLLTEARSCGETVCSLLRDVPEVQDLFLWLQDAIRQLDRPMRIAVIGRTKAGKSTLMNAFLGQRIVPMGVSELTYVVTRFTYSDRPVCKVSFFDGHDESWAISDLDRVVARDESRLEFLRSIKSVAVGFPNDLLRQFEILDTPGLGSVHEHDEQNTLRVLGIDADEVNRRTQTAVGDADAVLFSFKIRPGEAEFSTLQRFESMAFMDPVNAIAILTQVDEYFPDVEEPFPAARKIIDRQWGAHPILQKSFFAMRPVSGLMALGAATLSADDIATLSDLAAIPEAILAKHIWSSPLAKFKRAAFPMVPGLPSPEQRARLAEKLSFYGTKVATELVSRNADLGSVSSALYEKSGVEHVSEVLKSHFGRRSAAVKTYQHFERAREKCFLAARRLHGWKQRRVDEALRHIASFLAGAQPLRELAVLRRHYSGELRFEPSEFRLLLEITGEYGETIADRLGLRSETIPEVLLAEANRRKAHFHELAQFGFPSHRATREASRVLEQSCDGLIGELS